MTAANVFASLHEQRPEAVFGALPTPCYVLDEAQLIQNGKVLAGVAERTGCKMLLAQKAFSNYDLYPALAPYLAGTEASGLFEARLGHEQLPEKEVHVFCAAYREQDIDELLRYADHIVFNSPAQLAAFGRRAKDAGRSVGLRINPERSTQEGHAIYDPCAPGSRLGTTRAVWDAQMTPELIGLLDGLHFHTLCEQDSDALETTLAAVAERFGDVLPQMQWLNMGGGHHITRADYDIPRLERCILRAKEAWGVQVYLEPGEAWALNAGFLVSRVLDVVESGGTKTAILDASAACHMPDVIEMPYTPPVWGSNTGDNTGDGSLCCEQHREPSPVLLAGPTCLAGDVIGEYRFPEPLKPGDVILFGDMAIYSTCKNNTFNGIPLPDIYVRASDGGFRRLTEFGYNDFKCRLGKMEN